MSIPIRGTDEFYKKASDGWADGLLDDNHDEITINSSGELVVIAGKVTCPKYNKVISAAECASCGECLSPIALRDNKNYTVKCGFKTGDEVVADNNGEEMVKEVKVSEPEIVEAEAYDWEQEKVKEIEKIIGRNVKKVDRDTTTPASKLIAPNDITMQMYGNSSVARAAGVDEGNMGRNIEPQDKVSMFDTKDSIEEKLAESIKENEAKIAERKSMELQSHEDRKSYEKDYLDKLNNILEAQQNTSSIKMIAEEVPQESPSYQTPTGKIGLFETAINLPNTEDSDSRSAKKDNEWAEQQEQVVDKYVTQDNSQIDVDSRIAQLESGVNNSGGFGIGKDKPWLFGVQDFLELKDSKTTEEIIRESKEAERAMLGVREEVEAEKDTSWDDYEAQKSDPIQSDAVQEMLNHVADIGKLENLLSNRPA